MTLLRRLSLLASAGVFAAVLAGCASSVPLDTPPVEDKTGTAVKPEPQPAGSGATAAATSSRNVQPVDLNAAGSQAGMGPNAARVVYFDFDSFVVKPEFQPVIENQARYLRADKTRKAVIEGHTDERGGREYNIALGQKRSEAVRRALVLLGVPDGQLDAVSFGKEKPAAAGSDEAAMAKNRRAEIAYRN